MVISNLERSFPQHSEREIKVLGRKFYRHLCDLIVESIKLFSISLSEAQKRFKVVNPELLDNIYNQGRSVVLVGGHYNNWEMLAVALPSQIKHHTIGIYSPLNNAFFNQKFISSRSKYGLEMLATKKVTPFYNDLPEHPVAVLFGADQSPTYSKNVHWMDFLGQDTAVALGTEKFAKKCDHVVVYGGIKKVKRGHFEFTLETLTDTPKTTEDGEISEMHTKRLEQDILEQPEHWLWSHKRWKRQR